MRPSTKRRYWLADRIPLQRAAMALTLEVFPLWRTIPELARISDPAGHSRGQTSSWSASVCSKATARLYGPPKPSPQRAAEAAVTPSAAATPWPMA